MVKKNGAVRICGDYKVTANRATLTESYPLPLVDELMTDLAGGKYFTKLDLSQAYLQLPLDNESSELLTIPTRDCSSTTGYHLVCLVHQQYFSAAWRPSYRA